IPGDRAVGGRGRPLRAAAWPRERALAAVSLRSAAGPAPSRRRPSAALAASTAAALPATYSRRAAVRAAAAGLAPASPHRPTARWPRPPAVRARAALFESEPGPAPRTDC